MNFNPLSFDAAGFLWLYGLALVASLGLSWFAANRLRPTGQNQSVDDPDSLALLAGGTDRLTETAIARLLANGLFTASGPGFDRSAAAGVVPSGGVDRAMAALPMPARWADLRRVAGVEAARLRRSLESCGLMLDDDMVARLRLVQFVPFTALLALGTARLLRGVMLGNPVGILVSLLAITLVIGLARLVVDRRTHAGIAAVRLARRKARRLRLAPTRPEMPLAVAMFGTVVLAGSALEPLYRLRCGSDGGSIDASSGDSGCGGGGCGGCGG
jgi:uncharacterized protein (TIGR04222 family)